MLYHAYVRAARSLARDRRIRDKAGAAPPNKKHRIGRAQPQRRAPARQFAVQAPSEAEHDLSSCIAKVAAINE